jgi:hypothetical protein
LNLWCSRDKVGNHKLELIDVGKMSQNQILQEIGGIFELDPYSLGVMRVDYAVDVPDLPVQWFRESVRVEHKRHRAAVTSEPYYHESGTVDIQTLYFGRRPNTIRIYDKQAEYRHQYRTMVRYLGKDVEPPSFESEYGVSNPDSILTRVERQIVGRVPAEIGTLRQVTDSGSGFRPFSKLKIIDHPATPEDDPDLSFKARSTGRYLRSMIQNDGMQATNAYISKHSNGNAAWARKKYRSFLVPAPSAAGLTGADLQRRFEESLDRQMSGGTALLSSSEAA